MVFAGYSFLDVVYHACIIVQLHHEAHGGIEKRVRQEGSYSRSLYKLCVCIFTDMILSIWLKRSFFKNEEANFISNNRTNKFHEEHCTLIVFSLSVNHLIFTPCSYLRPPSWPWIIAKFMLLNILFYSLFLNHNLINNLKRGKSNRASMPWNCTSTKKK